MSEKENNELKLVISTETALGVGLPAEIAFNYDELKRQLTGHVAKYDGLVVQDGEIADARRIRAEINGMIAELTDAGRRVKKNWNTPLDTFLGRVKELISIAKPIEEQIGAQIKDFDERKREQRRKEVEDVLIVLVNEAVKDDDEELATIFINSDHWHSCVKPEMLAASASKARVRSALDTEVKRCREQVENAKRIYGPKGDTWMSKAFYALARWDYDAQTAFADVDRQIAEAERIEKRKAEEAERKRLAEEEAKARLAEKRAQMAASATAPAPVAAPTPVVAPAPSVTTVPSPAIPAEAINPVEMTYTLRITGPREKLFALREWLESNGLKFEKL